MSTNANHLLALEEASVKMASIHSLVAAQRTVMERCVKVRLKTLELILQFEVDLPSRERFKVVLNQDKQRLVRLVRFILSLRENAIFIYL